MIFLAKMGVVLAATALPEPAPPGKGLPKFLVNDFVIIVALGFLLMVGMIFWAAVIRGPKQQTAARRIYKSSQDSDDGDEDKSGRRRKKKKVRRREHRTRRPTLSEAGGLPLPKAQNQQPPPGQG